MKHSPDCLKLFSLFWLQVLVLMGLMDYSHCQLVMTDPQPVGPPPFMVYKNATLNEEVSVTCTHLSSGVPVWQLVETMEYLTFVNNTAVNHSYIQVSSPINFPSMVTLTITNFTSDLNRFSIVCRPDETSTDAVSATIHIGLLVPPMLSQEPVYNVVENKNATINVVVNDPFPPQFHAMWTCDSVNIFNNVITCPKCGGITVNMGTITLQSVPIACSETNFQVVVPSAMPQQIYPFTLNVLYPPSAQSAGILSVFASVNDNVTLKAINGSVDGNPTPTVSWRFNGPDGPSITASGRYSMESDGLLSISSITKDDFGEYYFTASNNIGEDITAIISLLEIEPRIKFVGYVSQNGGLTFNFSLIYTGYENDYTQVSINASCNKDSEPDPADLSYVCPSGCIDSNLIGNGSIKGPIEAGNKYQCSVTVSTNNGSDTFTIDSIIPTSGIPLTPDVSEVTFNGTSIIIRIHSQFPGDYSSFVYVVTVVHERSGRTVYNANSTWSDAGSVISTGNLSLDEGNYLVSVRSRNKYGESEVVRESVMVKADLPTNTTNDMATADSAGTVVKAFSMFTLAVIVGIAILYQLFSY